MKNAHFSHFFLKKITLFFQILKTCYEKIVFFQKFENLEKLVTKNLSNFLLIFTHFYSFSIFKKKI